MPSVRYRSAIEYERVGSDTPYGDSVLYVQQIKCFHAVREVDELLDRQAVDGFTYAPGDLMDPDWAPATASCTLRQVCIDLRRCGGL